MAKDRVITPIFHQLSHLFRLSWHQVLDQKRHGYNHTFILRLFFIIILDQNLDCLKIVTLQQYACSLTHFFASKMAEPLTQIVFKTLQTLPWISYSQDKSIFMLLGHQNHILNMIQIWMHWICIQGMDWNNTHKKKIRHIFFVANFGILISQLLKAKMVSSKSALIELGKNCTSWAFRNFFQN